MSKVDFIYEEIPHKDVMGLLLEGKELILEEGGDRFIVFCHKTLFGRQRMYSCHDDDCYEEVVSLDMQRFFRAKWYLMEEINPKDLK